jgi:outer membrane protein OmpA-like peptidoglycan-associated protein
MRCNPSYWLLGLVPIAMLSWVAVQLQHEDIENDLARRTAEALKRAGLAWATPHVAGRDVVLTGKAPEERGPMLATAYARNVWGVRTAYNRSGLIAHVANYKWTATSDGSGRIRLAGDVPSERARRALLDTAKEAFPSAAVTDNMHLARGSIDRASWLAGAKFSLKTLAELKRGEAHLAALDLSMRGEAATSQSYRDVRAALAKRRPAGIDLAHEEIAPPVAKPYVWSAKKGPQGFVISGYAPTENSRSKLVARAKSLFANFSFADRTDVADGAPQGWTKAITIALEQLAQLKSGEASFRDRDLTFSGEAADEQLASAVRRTLKLDVPQNFKIIDHIRYPKPDLFAAGSGYVMGIVNSGSSVDVVGMIPSEAARGALVDAVKARFPGRTVNDKTQVAPGAPEGWQQCVVAGLASLPRLNKGKSLLSNHKLEVSGETDDYAASKSLPADIKAAAGQACETTTDIAFTGKMKTDLSWKATRGLNGMITLEGDAPDDPSRLQLIETAQRIWAGESIADHMKIVGASPEPWLSVTRVALEQLARLRRGDVEISAKDLMIEGAAETDKVAGDIRSVLSTDLPPGYKAHDAITVMSPEEKAADGCQTLMRETSAKGIINFARAKADLTPDSTQTLKDLAEVANECPAFKIEIEGHTDAEGTDERNQRLSDRRAHAVADFLARNGVDPKRLSTIGYGATRPIADNSTAAGRAKNRRIEFNVKVN